MGTAGAQPAGVASSQTLTAGVWSSVRILPAEQMPVQPLASVQALVRLRGPGPNFPEVVLGHHRVPRLRGEGLSFSLNGPLLLPQVLPRDRVPRPLLPSGRGSAGPTTHSARGVCFETLHHDRSVPPARRGFVFAPQDEDGWDGCKFSDDQRGRWERGICRAPELWVPLSGTSFLYSRLGAPLCTQSTGGGPELFEAKVHEIKVPVHTRPGLFPSSGDGSVPQAPKPRPTEQGTGCT